MTDVDARLKEIAERESKATNRSWRTCGMDGCPLEFIAHARTDIPWLLSEVQRLRKAINGTLVNLHSMRFKQEDNNSRAAFAALNRLSAALNGGEP